MASRVVLEERPARDAAMAMTPEEIDSMPAGAKMDALVYDHVFGYKSRQWTPEDKQKFSKWLRQY
jgi:hypothetical protein